MKFFLRLSVFIVAVIITLTSFRFDDQPWVTYKDKKKAKFEVQFPTKPKADKKKDSWFISATLDEPLTNFYVNVDFGSSNYDEASFRTKVDNNINVIESVFSTKIKDKTEFQFNGSLCIEYSYEMFGMKSLQRSFYKNNIVYELTINPIVGTEIPADAKDKFFSSFHFL
ncbi:MAG TPA: hypothetical protein DCQ93_07785 [Bacteroidetes bacterium]|nr:hypothetical protein [Bacteroidota bacterium]